MRGSAAQRGGGGPLWLALLLALAVAVGAFAAPAGPLAATVPPPDHPPPGNLPWLSVGGDRIVDQQGRTVLLRGFDVSALVDPAADPQPLDDTDLSLMRRAGADVVRVPVTWAGLEPEPGRFDAGYADRVAALVARCAAHGLAVVLDMHFLGWGGGYAHQSGAPAWATVPGLPSEEWGLGSFGKYLSPAVNADLAVFWLTPAWQEHLLAAWRLLAGRLRGNSGVAGYDLYNEPHASPIPPVIFEKQFLWHFYQRAIDAIGAADPNHLFIVEGLLFEDFGTTIVPLRAPNLVYSPHLYTGSLVPPEFNGDPATIDGQVAMEAQEARRLGAPLWAGEIGIDHDQRMAVGWTDAVLDAYDDQGAGWGWWQWRQDGGWGIRNHAGTALDLAFLRHLARPYLAAAPAGVTGGRGDGVGGHLELRVDAEHGPGEVEVAWPSLTLPPPHATGECVATSRWRPDAARLTLTLVPQRGCSVDVSAGDA